MNEWLASRSGLCNPWKRALGAHCTGDWVGPKAGLEEEKIRRFLTLPERELDI
jgi:hypothetical protein